CELTVRQQKALHPFGDRQADEQRDLLLSANRELLESALASSEQDPLRIKLRSNRDVAIPAVRQLRHPRADGTHQSFPQMLRVVPAGLDESFSEELPSPVVDFQRMFASPSRLDRPAGLFSLVLHIVAADLTQCSFGSPQVVLQPTNLLPGLRAVFLRLSQVALVGVRIF